MFFDRSYYCDSCYKTVQLINFIDVSNCNGFENKIPYIRLCKQCISLKKIDLNNHYCNQCGFYFIDENEIDKNSHKCYKCLSKEIIFKPRFKFEPVFYDDSEADKLYIGIQLENNGYNSYKKLFESAKNIYDNFKIINNDNTQKIVYLKGDRSIGEFGYEVVTQPATLLFHKSFIPWKNFFDNLQMKSRKHCGLHFHIDKSYLTDFKQKALDFIINNNMDIIENISGRRTNKYCKCIIKQYDKLGKSETRYESINFVNKNTIQFRFFSSPKSYNLFMTRLQFVVAITKFIRDIDDSILFKYINNLNEVKIWNLFSNYLKQQEESYPYLYKYIVKNAVF